jgi:hypothetical protein
MITPAAVLAHLEWWATPSTCLASVPIRLTPAGDTAWNATASPELDPQADEDLQLLIEADPIFTLRFGNDSTTTVVVEPSGELNQLRLSAAPNPNV